MTGYTPEGLKRRLREARLTRKQVALLLDVSTAAIHRWCLPLDSAGHRDMPLKHWRALVQATDGRVARRRILEER